MRSLLFVLTTAALLGETAYQKPPQRILDVLNAPPPATVSVSPARDYAIFLQATAHPSIAELAQPMLRLAGLRIDVNTNGPHLLPHNISYTLVNLQTAAEQHVTLPAGERKLSTPVWSPDGKHFAFTNTTGSGIDLWIATTATGEAHVVPNLKINAVIGEPIGQSGGGFARTRIPVDWLADNRTLLLRMVPPGRGQPPAASPVPQGPAVQQSSGHSGPVRTYEDMLSSSRDEDLFTYYATAQLASLDTATGQLTPIAMPAIFTTVKPSPDGQHLLVSWITRPYSYLHPYEDFPTEVQIWDLHGAKLASIATLPLADRVPIDGVRTGPRNWEWLPTKDATLTWVEAMDGGNPKEKVPHRDRILSFSAPFKNQPVEITQTEQRFRGMDALAGTQLAFVEDFDRDKRLLRTMQVDLSAPGAPAKIIFSRNIQDRYHDPGTPVLETLPNGAGAIAQHDGQIFLDSLGATPQGDKPFLDRYDLATGKATRLFQSAAGYELPEAVLDNAGTRILTRRESLSNPPNYFVRTGDRLQALTHAPDPSPQIHGVTKKLITYQREDGVPLSFTLYLPPDYKPGAKLPALLWAYPYEYNDASTAGQVSGSTERFTTLTGHLLLVLQGYAVLENAGMPVIGNPETVNNTYLQQIVMDAKAAIQKAADLGVVDPNRVAVGGHSYGAFMTANLLAHCTLFRAGIAESGAYNRTLTPFGFQTERRTLWEAPGLYIKMSPFMSANTIKAPLLLIHGEADDNTGTFPINSERLYQAVRGNGGTVRLVMLPLEAHAYAARETLGHVLWEELNWLDKNVKTSNESAAGALSEPPPAPSR